MAAPLPERNAPSGDLHAEVLEHRPDRRRRHGRHLLVWTMEDGQSRLIDVRACGVIVAAAKARDGKPVSADLFRALDAPVRDYVKALA